MKVFAHANRIFWASVVVLIILLGSFYFMGSIEKASLRPSSDDIRVENAKSIIFALKTYRHEKGAYPIRLDKEVKDLTDPLVKDGFIDAIPVDPPDKQATRYVSDGKVFGLRIHQDSGVCIVEIDAKKTGWWEQPPPCEIKDK
jgi:hypothetical protein